MAYNNTVILTGNMGAAAKIVEKEKTSFAAFSLATTDSYKDKDGNWQNKEAVWHDVVTFNTKLIERLKKLDTKSRIKVTGALSYRFFEASVKGDKPIKKKEASIIAYKIELAPLVKNEPK